MNFDSKNPDYNVDELQPFVDEKGMFFDFALKTGHPIIIDYSRVTREIIPNILVKDAGFLLGRPKEKIKIESIAELKNIVNDFISKVYMINLNIQDYILGKSNLMSCPLIPKYSEQLNSGTKSETWEHIANQLVFDILFDKYLMDSPKLTLNQYCNKHINYNWDDSIFEKENGLEGKIQSTSKWMATSIEREIDRQFSSQVNAKKLGRNPRTYLELIVESDVSFQSKRIMPKYIWDFIYYNGHPDLITSKQFKRSFNRNKDNNNYTFEEINDYFRLHDKFVGKVFMIKNENSMDYFYRSMDFYFLEIYKRIDFIYKLAKRIEIADLTTIDKNYFLVRRFHPAVLWLSMNSSYDRLYYNKESKYNYYRPLLMLEEWWQEMELFNPHPYGRIRQDCYTLRAKVKELLKYHCEFFLTDYNDIAEFIRRDYNILAYHDPNKEWIQEGKKKKREQVIRIKNAMEINNALFWDSDK